MRYSKRSIAVVAFVGLALAGCSKASDEAENKEEPATVEAIEGSNLKRVELTDDAAKRVGLETAVVMDAPETPGQRTIPYAAVLYDANGQTWTYTSPQPHVYVRAPVVVDRIKSGTVFLTDGPPSGTTVVTVGAEELLGSETVFGED